MLHDGSTGDVTNSTISACTSDMGGAAMLESSILTMESTKVSNCTAITQGGAFLVYHNANATLVDTVVTGGSTSGWGGGFLSARPSPAPRAPAARPRRRAPRAAPLQWTAVTSP